MTRFQGRWPVIDDTLTVSELVREATPDLHAMAARDRVMLLCPVEWEFVEGPDGDLTLVGSAPAVRLDDLPVGGRRAALRP